MRSSGLSQVVYPSLRAISEPEKAHRDWRASALQEP